MRISEIFFEDEYTQDDVAERLIIVLKNLRGRAASKKVPAKFNWNGLQKIMKGSGVSLAADYETFKSIYDSVPAVQNIVKNFNADGIELDVPGAPDADKEAPKGKQSSQDAVDKIASSAAPKQLAKQ